MSQRRFSLINKSSAGGGGYELPAGEQTIVDGTEVGAVLTWDGTDWAEDTRINASAAGGVRVFDDVIDVYTSITHDGTDGTVGTATGDLILRCGSSSEIRTEVGKAFTLLGGIGLDSATFQHDGTDFITDFANTTDWNITNLSGRVKQDAETLAYLSEVGMSDALNDTVKYKFSTNTTTSGDPGSGYIRFSQGTLDNNFTMSSSKFDIDGTDVSAIWERQAEG